MSMDAQNPPLTTDQIEAADFLITECGLAELAETELVMMGSRGTVHYGLGRCATYLMDRTPEEIKDMVLLNLQQQTAE